MPIRDYKSKCEAKVLGSLKYCRMEECTETVHREDSPTHYPCCDRHKNANEAFWEFRNERIYHDLINKELYDNPKIQHRR